MTSPILPHLAVLIGGGLGAWLRFLCGRLQMHLWPQAALPVATLMVNLVGCCLMGALYRSLSQGLPQLSLIWLLLATGLLGGFTTFSAFSLEMLQLCQKGQGMQAFFYFTLTLTGTLGGVWLGWWGAGFWTGTDHGG